jgi:hypothetical protein
MVLKLFSLSIYIVMKKATENKFGNDILERFQDLTGLLHILHRFCKFDRIDSINFVNKMSSRRHLTHFFFQVLDFHIKAMKMNFIHRLKI